MKKKNYKKIWIAWVEGDFVESTVYYSKAEAQEKAEEMARVEVLGLSKQTEIRIVYLAESIAVFVAPILRPVPPVKRIDL